MDKFSIGRRAVLMAIGAAVTVKAAVSAALVKSAQRPDPKSFETGDIVWPKPPGAFVPYAGVPSGRALVEAEELREETWNQLRVEFIRQARSPVADADDATLAYQKKVADIVENMTYSSFFHEYAAGVKPDEFQAYGVGQLAYVGHVAIIEIDTVSRMPYVIEAVYGQSLACKSCVQRVPYRDWLNARGDILVWHGRVRNIDAQKRTLIAASAKQELNKPYRFFNFDLSDNGGFYCSKLLWYSVFKATGIAIDGKTDARRFIWFSPLQAIRSENIELLSSPGNYRNV
jgi:hypothetical protein